MAKKPKSAEDEPSGDAEAAEITEAQKVAAEDQIVSHHKTIDYDTREYPVEVLVQKYLTRLDEDDNELFVPDYQREHTWSDDHQSKFIESVLIGLPIPYLFVADVPGKEGRLEIVDGSQRIRTLASFVENKLKLNGLKKLTNLNSFTFADLPISRQRRFNRHTLRMIELNWLSFFTERWRRAVLSVPLLEHLSNLKPQVIRVLSGALGTA